MKKVFKKVTAATMAATMVVGLAACGGSGSGSSDKSASKSDKIKIGVSIWSSTDVLGSQCKKILMKQQKLLMSKYSMLTRDMFLKKLQHL